MAFEGLIQNYTNKIAGTKAKLENSVSSTFTNIVNLNNDPNICSSQNQQKILTLINKIQALNSNISSLQNSVSGVSSTVNKINQVLQVIQKLLFVLKLLPIPARFVTVGIIMTVTTVLNATMGNITQAASTVSQANNVIQSIKTNIAGIKQSLSLLLQQLNSLIVKVKQCPVINDDLKSKLNDQQLTLSNNIDGINSSFPEGTFYKGLKLDILEEKAIDPNIPALRRRAIASNAQGIEVIQGELTYATDKNVLFDELKLLIDKNNIGDDSTITENQMDQDFGFDSNTDITSKLTSTNTQLQSLINSIPSEKQLLDSLKT